MSKKIEEKAPTAGSVHITVSGPDEAQAVDLRIAIQNHLTGKVRFAGSAGAKCAVVVEAAGKKKATTIAEGLIEGIDGWVNGYEVTVEDGEPLADLAAEDAALAALTASSEEEASA